MPTPLSSSRLNIDSSLSSEAARTDSRSLPQLKHSAGVLLQRICDANGDYVTMKNVTSTDVWDSLSLDLVSIQVDNRIVFINMAGAKMLGAASPAEITGKPMLDFVHPDDREVAAERSRQMANGTVWVSPSAERWVRLDGAVIQVEVAARPLFYEGKLAVQLIVRKDEGYESYRPARTWHSASRLRRKRQ